MGHVWTGACGIFHQINGPVTFGPEFKKIRSSFSNFMVSVLLCRGVTGIVSADFPVDLQLDHQRIAGADQI